jgi:high-affinity nickel-transport protein
MLGVVTALHVLGWGLLALAVIDGPKHLGTPVLGVGTGILAYTLGLRHAFDADHISAIDNTTRRLMQRGDRPLSTGLWFSLGHSTAVLALTVLIGAGLRAAAQAVGGHDSAFHHYSGIIGTLVSGGFLYLIALLNMVVLLGIWRAFRDLRRGDLDMDELDRQLDERGLMMRFFGGLSRTVDAPWKLYPVGLLFGVGFDTASEVALLVISGGAVASGMPLWAILSLPLLFAAGMSMLDSMDGTFMNFAYGWAFSKPVRKIYYNLTITGLSVGVAFLIGTVELFSVIVSELHLRSGVWSWAGSFDINRAGFLVVALFVVVWAASLAVWKLGKLDDRFGSLVATDEGTHATPIEARLRTSQEVQPFATSASSSMVSARSSALPTTEAAKSVAPALSRRRSWERTKAASPTIPTSAGPSAPSRSSIAR